MQQYSTLDIERQEDLIICRLNRPEIRNAFNETMIRELRDFYRGIGEEGALRAVILRGEGKSFCAGADLEWMRSVIKYDHARNYAESYQLSECLHAIYSCPLPTLAVVHGAAIGGGNGLLAACDIVYAQRDTVFSLSEVKIGIVPACISPYVLKRVGEYPARELMITGRRFKGEEALRLGLVNALWTEPAELEDMLSGFLTQLRSSGPAAVRKAKELIYRVTNTLSLEEAMVYTAEMIAEIRGSAEGQEGMAAFLEKRKAVWEA